LSAGRRGGEGKRKGEEGKLDSPRFSDGLTPSLPLIVCSAVLL